MYIFLKTPPDFWLITKVLEPLTQKIQRWIGLDCFFWSKWSFVIAIVTGYIRMGDIIISGLTIPSSIGTSLLVMISLLIHYCIVKLNKHEMVCEEHGLPLARKLGYEAIEEGCKNPFLFSPRRYLFFWAMVELVFLFILFVVAPLLVALLSTLRAGPIVFGYLGTALMACTPLPPQKSKLREGLEKLKELLTPTPADEGLPAPAGA